MKIFTFLFYLFNNILNSDSDACTNYYKLSKGECGEVCLPDKLPSTVIKIVIKAGGLTLGDCQTQGYTDFVKKTDIKTPAGTFEISVYDKPTDEKDEDESDEEENNNTEEDGTDENSTIQTLDTCTYYNSISSDECYMYCIPNDISSIFKSILITTASLYEGTCESKEYKDFLKKNSLETYFGLFEYSVYVKLHEKQEASKIPSSCDKYYMFYDNKCGEICIVDDKTIMEQVNLFMSGLSQGDCKSQGFEEYLGLYNYAMPEGSYEVLEYRTKNTNILMGRNCDDYFVIIESECGEVCIPHEWEDEITEEIKKNSKLKKGDCKNIGYVDNKKTISMRTPKGQLDMKVFTMKSQLLEF